MSISLDTTRSAFGPRFANKCGRVSKSMMDGDPDMRDGGGEGSMGCHDAAEAARVRLFISYRDGDEPFGAALIDHMLSARFGTDRVFYDSKSIRPGDDYIEALADGIRLAAVLLVVIGRRWSAAAVAQPEGSIDWVKHEIVEAFRQGVRVIPVLLNVDPPAPADLPVDLEALARCQYVHIRHRYFRNDLDYLAHRLDELVSVMPRSAGPSETDDGG